MKHELENAGLETIAPEPRGLKEPQFAIGIAILLASCLVTLFVLVPAYDSAVNAKADVSPIIYEMAALMGTANVVSFVGIIWRSTKR